MTFQTLNQTPVTLELIGGGRRIWLQLQLGHWAVVRGPRMLARMRIATICCCRLSGQMDDDLCIHSQSVKNCFLHLETCCERCSHLRKAFCATQHRAPVQWSRVHIQLSDAINGKNMHDSTPCIVDVTFNVMFVIVF